MRHPSKSQRATLILTFVIEGSDGDVDEGESGIETESVFVFVSLPGRGPATLRSGFRRRMSFVVGQQSRS